MVGVQLLVGGLRFCMPPRWRSSWKMMHGLWGWATVGAGAANCVIGTFLMRDLLGMPWLTWLLPVVCPLGALMLGGMLLEAPRMRRVKEVREGGQEGRGDMPAQMDLLLRGNDGSSQTGPRSRAAAALICLWGHLVTVTTSIASGTKLPSAWQQVDVEPSEACCASGAGVHACRCAAGRMTT